MTQSLAKYHIRSPRYILQPQDNMLIRVAGPKQIPWEEGTEIKNISLSGIAFTAPSDICPSIGEFIKIEYDVPGSQKMACHALVTRLDDLGPHRMIVAVKYYRMDLSQRVILAQGLVLKLREQQLKRIQAQRKKLGWGAPLIPWGFLLMWIVLIYAISYFTWINFMWSN